MFIDGDCHFKILSKIDNIYKPEYEKGLKYDDKYLNINWEIEGSSVILSEKDKKNENFDIKAVYFK